MQLLSHTIVKPDYHVVYFPCYLIFGKRIAPSLIHKCKYCTMQIDKAQILHYNLLGGANMENLKELRLEKKLTQQQAADFVGISLRSYKSYENEQNKVNTLKYQYIIEKLAELNPIDEEHGIIDISYIKQKCDKVFEKYDINFCYLFGSYAKYKATPTSDVDLLISANVKGLQFYGLVEEIRNTLHKKVDVLDISQLNNNLELTKEILKDGIKIYG